MRLVTIFVVLASAGAAWAQTADAPPAPPPARPSAVADDNIGEAPKARRYDPTRIVCKKTKPKTGSRVVRDYGDQRICLTMAEWDRQTQAAQDLLKERDRGVCGAGGCQIGP